MSRMLVLGTGGRAEERCERPLFYTHSIVVRSLFLEALEALAFADIQIPSSASSAWDPLEFVGLAARYADTQASSYAPSTFDALTSADLSIVIRGPHLFVQPNKKHVIGVSTFFYIAQIIPRQLPMKPRECGKGGLHHIVCVLETRL